MQQEQFTILENQPLTASVFRMVLAGNAGEIRKPGQFVEVRHGAGYTPGCAHRTGQRI